jgi:putative NADH-flavin reductase
MKVLVLGASGGVGRLVVREAQAAGHTVSAQGRSAERLADLPDPVRRVVADPRDVVALAAAVAGLDAAIYAIGESSLGATTLFSDSTRALVEAMLRCGVPRLIAITGVGAGETRGHGGFVYDRIVFPLFTARKYADKNRQEALIRASGLDWTILRPAPFARSAGSGPLEVHETVAADLMLTRITRAEVARFAVGLLADPRSIRRTLFIGHR